MWKAQHRERERKKTKEVNFTVPHASLIAIIRIKINTQQVAEFVSSAGKVVDQKAHAWIHTVFCMDNVCLCVVENKYFSVNLDSVEKFAEYKNPEPKHNVTQWNWISLSSHTKVKFKTYNTEKNTHT